MRILTTPVLPAILALTVAACGNPGQKGDPTEETDVPPLESLDPGLAEAAGDCLGRQRAPEDYPNQLTAGDELQRFTLDHPQAVCNDGTPAVLYVRPATDPALAKVWSIHVQGGGACSSWAGCGPTTTRRRGAART
jgi:hypothetical protein